MRESCPVHYVRVVSNIHCHADTFVPYVHGNGSQVLAQNEITRRQTLCIAQHAAYIGNHGMTQRRKASAWNAPRRRETHRIWLGLL